MNYGYQLEKKGWLQGNIISKEQAIVLLQDQKALCVDINKTELIQEDFVLIVASQSCDLARNDVPSVQLLVARRIPKRDPQKAYNSHPRLLDTYISSITEDENGCEERELSIRINILDKIFISKSELVEVGYLENVSWGIQEERSYRNWLGEHYTRPALPTAFNDLLKDADGKVEDKLKKAAKQSNEHLYAIYININPNRELLEGESYKVQLLGALTNNGDMAIAETKIVRYKELIELAGINVTHALVRDKKSISMAMLEGMTRFHLDFLSYRVDAAELPAEVNPGI
jgi:hypothetical protein